MIQSDDDHSDLVLECSSFGLWQCSSTITRIRFLDNRIYQLLSLSIKTEI